MIQIYLDDTYFRHFILSVHLQSSYCLLHCICDCYFTCNFSVANCLKYFCSGKILTLSNTEITNNKHNNSHKYNLRSRMTEDMYRITCLKHV